MVTGDIAVAMNRKWSHSAQLNYDMGRSYYS